MDNSFQHDFFDDKYSEKKGIKGGIFHKYSKQRFLPQIRIPTEYVVIIAIGVLVLIIIAYAVGVEKGKQIQLAGLAKIQVQESQVIATKEVTPEETLEVSEKAAYIPELKEEKIEVPVSRTEAEYVVYLASFKRLGIAEAEIKKLKSKGFNAVFDKKGSWYQVFAPGYGSMKEAQEAKKGLSKYYRDCYIRKVK